LKLVTTTLLSLLLLSACDRFLRHGEVKVERALGPPIAVVEPAFVVLRPVSQTKTPETNMEASVYGQTVYFTSATVLDLSHFDLRTAECVTPEGTGPSSSSTKRVVFLGTTQAGGEILSRWTEENIGKQIGVFLDGKLISAPIIQSRIEDTIVLDAGFTAEQAAVVVARLRRGGAA
jgi:preprotein translocase subunit SecD